MFQSRSHAGKLLAGKLKTQDLHADVVVGIARGGVVIAQEIARTFQIPFDVMVVKKLGAPYNPELAIGAIAADDVTYIDEKLASSVRADKEYIKNEIKRKHHELDQREKLLRQDKPALQVKDKSVILTDDGVATGATTFASIQWLRKKQAKNIIMALPIAPPDTVKKLSSLVDKCVILETPLGFAAVGQFYQDFSEVTDEDVRRIIKSSNF